MMNLEYFTTRLSKNMDTIQSLVQGVAEEQSRWKPMSEEWSILEVINHLFLHIHQLAQLHWEYISLLAKSYSTDYAGAW